MKTKAIFLMLFIVTLVGCGSRQARLFETWGERAIIKPPIGQEASKHVISQEVKKNAEKAEVIVESTVQPRFPKMAFLEKKEGWVKLEIFLNSDGSVKSVQPVDSSPINIFETVSVNAVKQWRWKLDEGFNLSLPIYFFTEFHLEESSEGRTNEAR